MEPQASAIVLAILGALMGVSVLLSGTAGRLRIPLTLLYLGIGVVAGVGGLDAPAYGFAYRLGTASLVLILFDGGLSTSMAAIRRAVRPAVVLATAGVVGTTAVVTLGAHLLGFAWTPALLLGAVVSPTDAAAVFSALRGSRIELSRRVATTLELESGLNDPLAVLLTVVATEAVVGAGHPRWGAIALEVVVALAVGLVGGLAIGYLARRLLGRLRQSAHGLLPVFTAAVAFIAYGVPALVHGSGFLSVYVAAVVLGNGALPAASRLRGVHDALAWFGQVIMFVVLGLLSAPERLLAVADVGLALAALLAFVARPVVVMACLLPFRYPVREAAYIGWVGLRGAVPIVLAIYPVLRGVTEGDRLFHLVFFVVLVNSLVPGATVAWAARSLGLARGAEPTPAASVEVVSLREFPGEFVWHFVAPTSPAVGVALQSLPIPAGSVAALVVRGAEVIAPRGGTVLRSGDQICLFATEAERGALERVFGAAES